jgi:hypothetical protein
MASSKITALPLGTPKSTDVFPLVDVTDHSQAPSGTNKQYPLSALTTFVNNSGVPPNVFLVSSVTGGFPPYTTINAAVNAANAYVLANGGTASVIVYPGNYTEPFMSVSNGVSIHAYSPQLPMTISATDSEGRIFNIGPQTYIDNLNFSGITGSNYIIIFTNDSTNRDIVSKVTNCNFSNCNNLIIGFGYGLGIDDNTIGDDDSVLVNAFTCSSGYIVAKNNSAFGTGAGNGLSLLVEGTIVSIGNKFDGLNNAVYGNTNYSSVIPAGAGFYSNGDNFTNSANAAFYNETTSKGFICYTSSATLFGNNEDILDDSTEGNSIFYTSNIGTAANISASNVYFNVLDNSGNADGELISNLNYVVGTNHTFDPANGTSSIISGNNNTISGSTSTFLGGGDTVVFDGCDYAFGGGGSSNSMTGVDYGFSIGGTSNTAGGDYSFNIGGNNNTVSQPYSGTLNSYSVAISGSYSFGIGTDFSILNDGCLILADNSSIHPIFTTATQQMICRFNNGVGINVAPNATLTVGGNSSFARTSVTSASHTSGKELYIGVNYVGAVTITLSMVTGELKIIKDEGGNALLHNITITPASGTIDGNSSIVIATNGGAFVVYFDGTNYHIVSSH